MYRYRVELSQAEREELSKLVSGGKQAARKLKRTQILAQLASARTTTPRTALTAAPLRRGAKTFE